MPEPLAKLPDFYLQLPLFVHNAVYNESFALLNSIEQIIGSLTKLTRFEETLVQQLIDANSQTDVNDQVIAYMDGQLHALSETVGLFAVNGYPDMIACHMQEMFQLDCQRLISALHTLVESSSKKFQQVSRPMFNLVFEWNRRLVGLRRCIDALALAVTPYHDIKDERLKQYRLESMLSCIILSADGDTLIRDEHRIRTISGLYHDDESLSVGYKEKFSASILKKVESATILRCLSRGEFHSLLVMLLSPDSSLTTRFQAMDMLDKKWSTRLSDYPIDQKVDYYVVFFELMDCHGRSADKHQLMKMLFEDMDSLISRFPQNNYKLSTMYRLMQLRLLNNHYAVLSGPERILVCERSIVQLMKLLPVSAQSSNESDRDSRIARCVVKTLMVVQLDLIIAREVEQMTSSAASSGFSLFASARVSQDSMRDALHQQAISSIWKTPVDLNGLSMVLEELQKDIFTNTCGVCEYILEQLSGPSAYSSVNQPTHS